MNTIITHWSADNRVLSKKFYEQVETELTKKWKGIWYRRLWFYFFEQEIRTDVTEDIKSQSVVAPHHLLDPEYQALLARSAKGQVLNYETWDELTLSINDYIFSQGSFFEQDYAKADEAMVQLMINALVQGSSPQGLTRQGAFMSDVMLELRRARADIAIVSQLREGKHSYQTLLKMCGEYMGTFARVPRFVEYYPTGWSQETIMAAVDDNDRLEVLLEPSYTLECATLASAMIVPYGYTQIENTPYSTWFGKLGFFWAHCPWYVKIGVSVMIVLLSVWLGGSTLIILPIVWGLLAVARTESQYLGIFQNLLSRRYTSYSTQYTEYTTLYDTMVDPEQNTKDTVQAQHLMSRWFDVIPFSGHELLWEVTSYAKRLYGYLLSFSQEESTQKDVATMEAVSNWSEDNDLSLLIVQDGQYAEQALYRFEYLLQTMKKSLTRGETYEQEYIAQYESIDELVSGKKYSFWLWTFRNALRDGAVVAISSGVLGWMGSYLRNRSVGGSTALAAGPSLITPTLTQSDDILLSHTELLAQMKTEMSIDEINKFFGVMQDGGSDTLWDTMVDTFGFTKGNAYTNHLMDTWWRMSDDQTTSELFTHAFKGSMPVSAQDAGWNNMMSFLDRIYDYDNLSQYTVLLDQPWLSQTLQDLKTGEMTIADFAALPLEQREIVTQALFYHLEPNALQSLFDAGNVIVEPIIEPTIPDPIMTGEVIQTGSVIDTGSIVDTGAQDHTLELGNKILQWLGLHSNTQDIITGDIPEPTLTGDIDLPDVTIEEKLTLGQQFSAWKVRVGEDRSSRFALPKMDMFGTWKENVSNTWADKFPLPSWDEFVSWKERIAISWTEKFAWPSFSKPELPGTDLSGSIDIPNVNLTGDIDMPVIDTTGSIDLPDHTLTGDLTLTGDVVTGSVSEESWFSQFRTWLKGTPPPKIVEPNLTGSLVDTGVVDTILSGLNGDELIGSGTVIDPDALAPGQIAQFTLPVLRKDKTISEELKIMS